MFGCVERATRDLPKKTALFSDTYECHNMGTLLTPYPSLPPCNHCPFLSGLSLGTQRTCPDSHGSYFEDMSCVPLSLPFPLCNVSGSLSWSSQGWLLGVSLLPCPGCLLALCQSPPERRTAKPEPQPAGGWEQTPMPPGPINKGIWVTPSEAASGNCSTTHTQTPTCWNPLLASPNKGQVRKEEH